MNTHTNTGIIGSALLVILFVLANPFGFWMPTESVYLGVVALAVVSVLFAGIVFRDSSKDEREESLRNISARSGYLAGILILTGGIIVTALMGHEENIWLIGALAGMVISRLVTRFLID